LQATSTILERFRPPPTDDADRDDQRLMPAMQATGIADDLVRAVAGAEEALPLQNERISDNEMLARRIAGGFGPKLRDRFGRGVSEALTGTPSSKTPPSPLAKAITQQNKQTESAIATINRRWGKGEPK
jgi:hypothetical protein